MSPDAGTNVVDVYVNYLRKKLGAASVDGDDGDFRLSRRFGAKAIGWQWRSRMGIRASELSA